ncbi:hypothetical protein [Actomonas aquatica]|uniref:Uncharacterized protein n=1 Tax=Actomonas aquatica TaxID=2866162 RepID=A0ABZ1CDU4_9BACT|nr:hypothetical protein [Opitutus sp. WL0086]WRQ89781.1 hypothetical protein K1X11_010220 [Opitutus sp. WL0086]
MKFLILPLLAAALWAQPTSPSFVDSLPAEARATMGLEALTPAQLAVLEAAVQNYVHGRSASSLAEKEEELVSTRQQLEEAQAVIAEQENASDQSLIQRAKVLLTPGTKIEYTTVSSRLTEEFRGWNAGTLFRLENGQVWRVVEGKYWSPREDAGKAVTIKPGMLGSFFLEIEGVRQTPRVELVSRN